MNKNRQIISSSKARSNTMMPEWPAMKRVLESGDVEISNNISEQSVRKLKMNLRNAGNIGRERSPADNAFMYSVIESCKLNDIEPGKYISFLLDKLKLPAMGAT